MNKGEKLLLHWTEQIIRLFTRRSPSAWPASKGNLANYSFCSPSAWRTFAWVKFSLSLSLSPCVIICPVPFLVFVWIFMPVSLWMRRQSKCSSTRTNPRLQLQGHTQSGMERKCGCGCPFTGRSLVGLHHNLCLLIYLPTECSERQFVFFKMPLGQKRGERESNFLCPQRKAISHSRGQWKGNNNAVSCVSSLPVLFTLPCYLGATKWGEFSSSSSFLLRAAHVLVCHYSSITQPLEH